MALLDAYGRPVRQQKLTEPLAAGGMTGIRQTWAGSAASGLTPVKLASILRACDQGELREFLILAEEMEERDPHYFSVLGTRSRLCRHGRGSAGCPGQGVLRGRDRLGAQRQPLDSRALRSS